MKKGLVAGLIGVVVVLAVVGVLVLKKPAGPPPTEKERKEAVERGEKGEAPSRKERGASVMEMASVKGKLALLNVVPEDALIFLSAQDIRATWSELEGSNFWNQISTLEIWQTANVAGNLDILKEQFRANMGIDLSEENLLGLFGQDVGLVLVGGAAGALNPSLLIVAKLDPAAKMEDKINDMLDKFKDTLTITKNPYSGVNVTRVLNPAVPGPQFNYAFLSNLFVMGIGIDDTAVKKVIDLGTGSGGKALGNNAQYKEAMELVRIKGELRGIVYVNIGQIVNLIKAFPIPTEVGGVPFTEGIERTLGAIKAIAGAVSFQRERNKLEGIYVKLFFLKNDAITDPDILAAWDVKPAESKSLRFIPENSLLFSVSNSLDLGRLWELWQTNIRQQTPEQGETILSAIDTFEADSGISIQEDIISWIGEEIGFVVSDVDLGGLFPFPKIAIIINVKDEGKAGDSLGKLLNVLVERSMPPGVEGDEEVVESPITLGEETYAGEMIKYLEIKLPYQGLMPAYAILEDFLVIGSSRETVKSFIDVRRGDSKSITSDPIYRKTTADFARKVNQLGFINIARALEITIDITNWANTLRQTAEAAAGTEEGAEAGGVAATGLPDPTKTIIPFLQSLKSIHSVGVAAVNEKKGVDETVYIRIEDE